MNCRERALRAIRFQRPDRIPFTYTVTPTALFRHGQRLIDLCRAHPNDFYDPGIIKLPKRDVEHYRPDGSYYKEVVDEWGSVWVYLREDYMGEVKQPVLDDWSKLWKMKFPAVPNSSTEGRLQLRAELTRQKEQYVGWAGGGSLFEQMQWLRGTENLMTDIALDAPEVCVLADRLLEERLLPAIHIGLEAGADVIGFADDWGSQRQLLINPKAWRRIFKPRYRKMFDLVHQGGALAWMHSDGMQMDIIPDWIEIGLDVLNPQFSCNDMVALQKITAGRLCVCGDIDRQHLLACASPLEIEKYIQKVYGVFGAPQGGFIYGLAIEELPFENAEAALRAIDKFRAL